MRFSTALSLSPRALAEPQIRPEPQRDRLTLVVAQLDQRALDGVALADGVDGRIVVGVARLGAHACERPRLDGRFAGAVASEVHRNGVQPVLLASPPGVETGPRAERPLERVRDEIFGELAVTGPIDEKREQRLGVGLEQP